ncbi:TolC family protein [Pantoea agglomerans]|nr:TolC family protein [Pantoea agglomerans]
MFRSLPARVTGNREVQAQVLTIAGTIMLVYRSIFLWGDLSSRQAALSAEVSRKAGRLEADDMEQKLRRDILIATNDITTRWKQFVISQRAAELTQQKVDIERQKLAAGRSTNFQVVSFDADLRNAESARLAAAISYQNSLTELDEIMGTTLQSWGIMLNDQGNYAGQE